MTSTDLPPLDSGFEYEDVGEFFVTIKQKICAVAFFTNINYIISFGKDFLTIQADIDAGKREGCFSTSQKILNDKKQITDWVKEQKTDSNSGSITGHKEKKTLDPKNPLDTKSIKLQISIYFYKFCKAPCCKEGIVDTRHTADRFREILEGPGNQGGTTLSDSFSRYKRSRDANPFIDKGDVNDARLQMLNSGTTIFGTSSWKNIFNEFMKSFGPDGYSPTSETINNIQSALKQFMTELKKKINLNCQKANLFCEDCVEIPTVIDPPTTPTINRINSGIPSQTYDVLNYLNPNVREIINSTDYPTASFTINIKNSETGLNLNPISNFNLTDPSSDIVEI